MLAAVGAARSDNIAQLYLKQLILIDRWVNSPARSVGTLGYLGHVNPTQDTFINPPLLYRSDAAAGRSHAYAVNAAIRFGPAPCSGKKTGILCLMFIGCRVCTRYNDAGSEFLPESNRCSYTDAGRPAED